MVRMAICEKCGREKRVGAWAADCGCSRLTPAEAAQLGAIQNAAMEAQQRGRDPFRAHIPAGTVWGALEKAGKQLAAYGESLGYGTIAIPYYQPPVDDADAAFLRSLGIAP